MLIFALNLWVTDSSLWELGSLGCINRSNHFIAIGPRLSYYSL